MCYWLTQYTKSSFHQPTRRACLQVNLVHMQDTPRPSNLVGRVPTRWHPSKVGLDIELVIITNKIWTSTKRTLIQDLTGRIASIFDNTLSVYLECLINIIYNIIGTDSFQNQTKPNFLFFISTLLWWVEAWAGRVSLLVGW